MTGLEHRSDLVFGLGQGHGQRALAVGGQAVALIGRGLIGLIEQRVGRQQRAQRGHQRGAARGEIVGKVGHRGQGLRRALLMRGLAVLAARGAAALAAGDLVAALAAAPAAKPLATLPTTVPGTLAARLSVSLAASKLCLTRLPARLRAASVALSFIAAVASWVNCWLSAVHHWVGSMAAGAPTVLAESAAALTVLAAALAVLVAVLTAAWATGAAAASTSGGTPGQALVSGSLRLSRRSASGTFMDFKVDSVMRCTSSAWMVAASMRAFCSSQNCTVRSSSMRLASSSGFSVGATHWPMPGRAEPAFLTRP
mmetsp:Transcript_5564/g.21424  ORF Transcript_5564/g.21424 Transcript_5564/m.21424 type:complete len:312 (+) Transcript_5564:2217-3152(+)